MKRLLTICLSLLCITPGVKADDASGKAHSDCVAFTRAYGIIRHYSPNHHADSWNDLEWFKVGYYYADMALRTDAQTAIGAMLEVFAPSAYLTSEPDSKQATVDNLKGYQYRLHTGGGESGFWWYRPYRRDIIRCSNKQPEYAPQAGKWYCYPLSDGLYLNLQSAARRDDFSKRATKDILRKANDLWDALYSSKGDYMAEVVGIFNNRAYRLIDLATRWNIVEHFYPYKAEDKLDWDKQLDTMMSEALSERYDKADRSTVFEYWAMLRRMYSPIRDSHLEINRQLAFPDLQERWLTPYYIPLTFTTLNDCIIVNDNEIGIEPGSRLTHISGKNIEAVIAEQGQQLSLSNQSAQRRMATLEALSSFDRGSAITLDYITPEGVAKSVSAKATLFKPLTRGDSRATFELRGDILIVNPCTKEASESGFYKSFMHTLEESAPRAIIFDVRGYPTYHFERILSHLTTEEMSNAFFATKLTALPSQTIVGQTVSKESIKPSKPHISTPCYFLTDYSAISWAETVLMYVREYRLGTIVGTPSSGTTGDITRFEFPAFSVTFTGLHAAWLDGAQHHGIGVIPDIVAHPSAEDHIAGVDTILEHTIQLINQGEDH